MSEAKDTGVIVTSGSINIALMEASTEDRVVVASYQCPREGIGTFSRVFTLHLADKPPDKLDCMFHPEKHMAVLSVAVTKVLQK